AARPADTPRGGTRGRPHPARDNVAARRPWARREGGLRDDQIDAPGPGVAAPRPEGDTPPGVEPELPRKRFRGRRGYEAMDRDPTALPGAAVRPRLLTGYYPESYARLPEPDRPYRQFRHRPDSGKEEGRRAAAATAQRGTERPGDQNHPNGQEFFTEVS